MVRLSLSSLPFLGLILFSQSVAHAEEPWWRDPERGCGKIETWKRTSRIADLPGCDGELKSGAPPGEVAMHDAKKLLHDVEKQLDAGQTSEAEAKIAQAVVIMNKAPSDARVNWARFQFESAINILKTKMTLAPRVAKLRTAYKTVADLAAQPKPDGKALSAAADACVQAFKDAETQGANLTLQFELTAGKPRPLREDLAECEAAKTRGGGDAVATADTAKPAGTDTAKPAGTDTAKPAGDKKGGSDGGVPRAKWTKKLKGDRKKVFEDHADAFPEYEGDPGPKGAAKATEWKYGSESFKFKGSKLVKPK
jgi:hypothetical protein